MKNQKEEHMRGIAGIVYVVTADTWEESAADYKDRVGLNHGVLRLFTNKDDGDMELGSDYWDKFCG